MVKDIKDLRIYILACEISDDIWSLVSEWKTFEKNTIGSQTVRAADSIGANISEGYGRYHFKEDITFLYYARGSTRESIYWLERAHKRGLIADEKYSKLQHQMNTLLPQISAYIKSVKERSKQFNKATK